MLRGGVYQCSARSILNFSLIISLAYIGMAGSILGAVTDLPPTPTKKSWNFVHLYVMEHPFIKICLCVMMQLTPST